MARTTTPPPARDYLRRYVFVASRDQLYDRWTRNFISVKAAVRRHAHEMPDDVDGERALMRGPNAVDKVDGTTYSPRQLEIVDEDDGRMLNRWTPTTLQPRPGSAWPFTQHLARIVDGDERVVAYVLDYLAHLVQRPDIKIRTALLFIGRQGTGKSILADVVIQMVGQKNAKVIDANDLNSDFNSWIDSTSLTVVNELVGANVRSTAARLKNWITEDRVRVNEKNVRAYETRNLNHFVLLSNDQDAALIDADDRRYLVWRSTASPQPPSYYMWLRRWLAGGGYGRVLHFLQQRDISRFSPFAAPPRTASRAELARESRSDLDVYLADAMEAAEPPFVHDLVVVNHIVDYMADARRPRVQAKAVTGFLRSVGAECLGQKRLGHGAAKSRVWAVRDVARWIAASEREIATSYLKPGQVRSESAPQPRRLRGAHLDEI